MNFVENVTTLLDFLEAFYNPTFDTIRNREYEVYLNFLDSCFKENKWLRQAAKEKLTNLDVKAASTYSSKFRNFVIQELGKMDAIKECSEALRFLLEKAKFGMGVSSADVDKVRAIFHSIEYFESCDINTGFKFNNIYESRLFYLFQSVFRIFTFSFDKNVDTLDEFFKVCKLALEKTSGV